jgi:hypothetical protein
MKLTVRKADGPGWLMIAETVENGLYKVVTERCGEEPPYDVILQNAQGHADHGSPRVDFRRQDGCRDPRRAQTAVRRL